MGSIGWVFFKQILKDHSKSFPNHLGECDWVTRSILSKIPRGAKNLCYTFRLALGKWMLKESFRGVTVMDGVMWAFGHWETYDHLWSWLKIWNKLSLQKGKTRSFLWIPVQTFHVTGIVGQTVIHGCLYKTLQFEGLPTRSRTRFSHWMMLSPLRSLWKVFSGATCQSNMMHASTLRALFVGLVELGCQQSLRLSRLVKSVRCYIL